MPPDLVQLSMPYAARPPRMNMRQPPLLILLHGLGTNEKDFIKLSDSLDRRFLVFSICAPFAQTRHSFAWFGVERIEGASLVNVAQAEHSREKVIAFIQEAVKTLKINSSQVYLLGHSQGAVIALNVLLTRPDLVAGVAAINGQVLPEIRSLIAPLHQLKGRPVLLIHGLQDAFYPISLGRAASALLSTLPLALEYYEYYMGHHLTPESMTKASSWLTDHLDAQGIQPDAEPFDFRFQLNSVHLKVRDLERSIDFYERYFGMRLTERVGKIYAFLTTDHTHHCLVLENVGLDALLTDEKRAGLYQIRFDVPDQHAFAQVFRRLRNAGVPFQALDHAICWSLQLQDPDGHGLEICWDTRQVPGGSDLWQGRDLPLTESKIFTFLGIEME